LAKSVDGEKDLVQVEEWIEKKEGEEDFTQVIKPRKGEPADKELYAEVIRAAKAKFDVYPSAYANAWVVREYKKRGGKYKAESKEKGLQSDGNLIKENPMETETIAVPESILGDLFKFDKGEYERAREALANLISIEAQEMKEGHNELSSISHLLEAVSHLHAWYEGEEAEGEVMEETEIEMAVKPEEKEIMPKKGETLKEFKARCKEAGMAEGYAEKCYNKYMAAEKEIEASAAATDMTPTAETGANLNTATIIPPADTPKSAEAEEAPVAEEVAEEAPAAEEVTEEVSVDENSTDKLEAIVEEVVEKATKALKSEIANLVSAKEAAEVRAMSLETELATAKSLALGGGPKRTVNPIDVKTTNDLLTKAAVYKEKAKATTDITLAKGYKILADEYIAEYEKTLDK
jgi:hypothetical protein